MWTFTVYQNDLFLDKAGKGRKNAVKEFVLRKENDPMLHTSKGDYYCKRSFRIVVFGFLEHIRKVS